MMEQDIYNKSQIISHYISVWGRDYRCLRWDDGAIKELGEDFLILEFPPQKSRMMWTYATCGMANSSNKKPVELHIFSNERDEFMVELLTVVAHFHKFGKKLDLWHTVNFGRSWKPKSLCLYGLISLPYLDGPNLEILNIENKTIHFYWLIPITKEEVVFKKEFGIDSLEDIFENENFDYTNPYRKSVI